MVIRTRRFPFRIRLQTAVIKRITSCVIAGLLMPFFCPSVSATEPGQTDSFAGMSLEDLLAMSVTSVAGVEQSLFETPAALWVINRDDLNRGGHRSLPEALRMKFDSMQGVPGNDDWNMARGGFRGTVEGSGMGLAVIKKIVESCGGTIHVESSVRGTSFNFTWLRIFPGGEQSDG